jgi:hypothetical protein
MAYTLEQCVDDHEEWLEEVNGRMEEIGVTADPELKESLISSLHKKLIFDFESLVSEEGADWTEEETKRHTTFNQLVAYTLAAFEGYYL